MSENKSVTSRQKSALSVDESKVGVNHQFAKSSQAGHTIMSDIEANQKPTIPRTHGDVAKVLAIVQKKKEMSLLAMGFFRYALFTAIYIAVVILQRDAVNAQSLQSAVRNYFLAAYRDPVTQEMRTYEDLFNYGHFWDWHEHFLNNLITVSSYNNGEPRSGTTTNYVLTHNRLCAGFRMVQRRGKTKRCKFDDDAFHTFAPNCTQRTYVDGLVGDTFKDPFVGARTGTQYVYEELDSGLGGGLAKDVGYFQFFGSNYTDNVLKMRRLRADRWIDSSTQWYRLDFVLYNPNVGLFAAVEFKFTFDNTGMILVQFGSEAVAGTAYTTWTEITRLVFEAILVIYWFVYFIVHTRRAIVHAREEGRMLAYFESNEKILIYTQLLLLAAIFGIWVSIANNSVRRNLEVTADEIRMKTGQPPNFTGLSLLTQAYFVLNGINILLTLVRILGYLRVNPNLSQLTDTLNLMLGDLLQFAVILITLLLAFMLMAHAMFGTVMPEFSSLSNSAINTFEFVLGSGDYWALNEADAIAAPIFYFPFVFVMIFVTLNITVAIIMDGYSAMQDSRKAMAESDLKAVVELAFSTQVKNGLLRLLSPIRSILPTKWRQIETPNGIILDRYAAPTANEVIMLMHDLIDDEDDTRVLAIEDIKKKLRGKQTTEERIEAIFDRYDGWVDPNAEDDEKLKTMQELITPKLKKLKEDITKIVKEQRDLEEKIELIVRAFPA